MRERFLLLVLTLSTLFPFVSFGADGAFEQFSNPPAARRILKIIHGWPDAPQEQDRLIASLKRQGFGGVVCNVSFKDYLTSEAQWKSFTRAVEEARHSGLAMWLYDEKGYPSGTAGGLVLKDHPEWQARGLLVTETNSTGGRVALTLPPGQLRMAMAFPVADGCLRGTDAVDLKLSVQTNAVVWVAPEGQWRILAATESALHEGTHADMSLSDHIPYPNLLSPEPTAKFLELTHSAYARHLPQGLGQYFTATFTDEPSLMSLFLRPMPYRVLPWSDGLSARLRKGGTAEALIPALVADVGGETRRTRYDYWRAVGELVSGNFLGQIQQWCRTNGVLSGGHLLMEENIVNQVPLYGNFFACLRRLDAPSIDCLTSVPEQVPWFIGRLASSAAELEGKRVVMCETSDHSQRYRPAGDKRPVVTVSKAQIRGTCNRLMLAGVNAITSYYTFAGLNDPDLQELNLWVGRCCSVLAESSPSADVAVLFPVESIWPRFIPARHLANAAPEASRIESVFHSVTEGLYASGQDFIYTDAESLSRAEVKGGELVLGKQHWRTVILPGADTLELGTWKKLSAFVLQGGTLLFVAKTPANSTEEFPSKEVLKISGELVGAPGVENKLNVFGKGRVGFIAPGQESLVPATVAGLLNPEIEFVGPHPKQLRYARRLGPGPKATYFVINDSNEGWTGEVKILSSSPGQEWDPNTGQRRSVKLEAIPASFRPYDARFYVVDSEFVRRSPSAGARLPELKSVELEYNAPAVGRGEFVREKVTSLNATNPGGGHEFSALITKSDVDTFLFARFEKASDWNLAANDFIELRSRVPRSQLTSSQLLVILHEEGGADYFASSGRWLNAEGEEKTIVPFSQFQLAGWSTDGNSRLNLDDITEIRIGWGGYFGKQGETVTFSVEDLKIGSVLGRTSQAKR